MRGLLQVLMKRTILLAIFFFIMSMLHSYRQSQVTQTAVTSIYILAHPLAHTVYWILLLSPIYIISNCIGSSSSNPSLGVDTTHGTQAHHILKSLVAWQIFTSIQMHHIYYTNEHGLGKMDVFFKARKNAIFEHARFNQWIQRQWETVQDSSLASTAWQLTIVWQLKGKKDSQSFSAWNINLTPPCQNASVISKIDICTPWCAGMPLLWSHSTQHSCPVETPPSLVKSMLPLPSCQEASSMSTVDFGTFP